MKKLPAYKEAGAKMHQYHDYTGKWEDWQEKITGKKWSSGCGFVAVHAYVPSNSLHDVDNVWMMVNKEIRWCGCYIKTNSWHLWRK